MNTIYELHASEVSLRPGSRMVARLLGETQLAIGVDVLRALEEHLGHRVPYERAVYLLMVLRSSARFRAASTGVASSEASAIDGISVNAMATSLNRPFETVRRHVNALIEDGICFRSPHGVIVRDETLAAPAFAALLRRLHDRMVRVIDDLRQFGVPLPARHNARLYAPDATMAAAIDLTLASFEYFGAQYRNWLELVIVNAVALASVRRIAFDAELARRYADADTAAPEELRELVSVAAIARTLRMSYSTVMREVNASIAHGKLVRVGNGVRASTHYLEGVTVSRGGHLAAVHAAMVLQRLGPSGFPFHDPASCYLEGKPALLDYA